METILLLNTAVSWALVILIWIVQVIIYPGFHRIPSGDFTEYHRWYVKRIAVIVLPLMIFECLALVPLLKQTLSATSIVCAGLVIIVWISTFLLQVPIHNKLKNGKNTRLIQRLVATNWIRTMAWSFKGLIIMVISIKQLIYSIAK